MSGRRRFICPSGFHRAMRLCFRAVEAVKLMTSGASPIAQMSGAVFSATRPRGGSCSEHVRATLRASGAPLVRPRLAAELSTSPWRPALTGAFRAVCRISARAARKLRTVLDFLRECDVLMVRGEGNFKRDCDVPYQISHQKEVGDLPDREFCIVRNHAEPCRQSADRDMRESREPVTESSRSRKVRSGPIASLSRTRPACHFPLPVAVETPRSLRPSRPAL
jgi:hypothetical protein